MGYLVRKGIHSLSTRGHDKLCKLLEMVVATFCFTTQLLLNTHARSEGRLPEAIMEVVVQGSWD